MPDFSTETRALLAAAGYFDPPSDLATKASGSPAKPQASNFVSAAEFDAEIDYRLPGDAYSPSPATLAKAASLRRIADQVRAADLAAYQPPVKDRAYYRRRWSAGFSGKRECEAHARSMGLELWQYTRWLWQDEPQTAAPSATPQAIAWAEQVLEGA